MTGFADWGDWVADWGDADTAQEKREALATLITSVLPDDWSVLASPPAIIPVPSVIVTPQGDYRRDTTFEKEGVMVSLRIVVQPGDDALDRIDGVMDLLCRGDQPILDVPSVTQLAIAGVTLAQGNGGDIMVGTINLTVS